MTNGLIILFQMMMSMYAGKELICQHIREPVKIDGRLDEAEWAHAQGITMQDIFRRKSDNMVTIRVLWDEGNLYVAFQVEDKQLQARQTMRDHPLLYMDDMVELLIDTRYARDSCWGPDDVIYHVNILGQVKDDRGTIDCTTDASWNGNARYAIALRGTLNDPADIDTGYNVEMAIPWEELRIKPSKGIQAGINFANGDNGKMFDWVGASPFRSPYAFGTLELKEEEE